jgi:hypothetical protein
MRSSANATTPDLCFTGWERPALQAMRSSSARCRSSIAMATRCSKASSTGPVITRSADEVVTAAIIDFKTDAIDSSDDVRLARRVEHYTPQLRAYRRAVAGMYRLPQFRVATRLVFVECAAVVDVV